MVTHTQLLEPQLICQEYAKIIAMAFEILLLTYEAQRAITQRVDVSQFALPHNHDAPASATGVASLRRSRSRIASIFGCQEWLDFESWPILQLCPCQKKP
jgi:hypothetical protein